MIKLNQKSKNEEFCERIDQILGKSYRVLGQYINNRIPVEMLHVDCGTKWSPAPMTLTRSIKPTKCPACFKGKIWTTASFCDHVKKETASEYTVTGEFKTLRDKLTFHHAACGHTYSSTPHIFLLGCRCAKCHGTPKKTTAIFKKEVLLQKGKDYEVVGEYEGTNIPIRMKHSCGHVWTATPNNLINCNTGCPVCKLKFMVSKSVSRIEEVLTGLKIAFKREVSFVGCRYKKRLRFDFYLPEFNLLIEYDGRQHFSYPFAESDDGLSETRLRDSIKNDWVIKNSISLLRIDYTKTSVVANIDKILHGFFSKERSTTIEKHKLYYVNEDSSEIFDNGKYDKCEVEYDQVV